MFLSVHLNFSKKKHLSLHFYTTHPSATGWLKQTSAFGIKLPTLRQWNRCCVALVGISLTHEVLVTRFWTGEVLLCADVVFQVLVLGKTFSAWPGVRNGSCGGDDPTGSLVARYGVWGHVCESLHDAKEWTQEAGDKCGPSRGRGDGMLR